MRILIDADACPVVDIAIDVAKSFGLECLLVCDTAHVFEKDGAKTITVSKGADSVDFALVNMLKAGDIAVTQDYGLAAMCLARQAYVIDQNGRVYTDKNIDNLLYSRHKAGKIRRGGGRLKGPPKRQPGQDKSFKAALIKLINDNLNKDSE
ncbi:MAG: YaiI/YqxD family protein [Clostridiales bacterium]|nr:YaiI/YqxD family protein [Clostridiales bacterium]